jgi:ceramide glucosyltransferase
MGFDMVNTVIYILLVVGAAGFAFTTAQVLLASAFLWCQSGRAFKRVPNKGRTVSESTVGSAGPFPEVSIIKPVSGIEDGLEMNLESFAKLNGPTYELIVSIADPWDPAIPIVEKALPLFNEGALRIVIGGATSMDNPKVERLAAAARHANGRVLLISDSNVRVPSDHLAATLSEFEDPRVGCAVNVFIADGAASPGSFLECLYILTFVLPGTILAASAGVTCVVGKSMALSRAALEKIGGFEAFAHVLAEDQSIGLAVVDAGYRVALSRAVVRNIVERRTLGGAVKRQIRWGKIRYSFSRLRYSCEFLCNPLPPLLVAATMSTIAGPSRSCALLAGSAIAARILQAVALRHLTGAKLPMISLALVGVQDCVQAVTHFIPYFSNYVDWRGFRTRLGRGTQILEPRQAIEWGSSTTSSQAANG